MSEMNKYEAKGRLADIGTEINIARSRADFISVGKLEAERIDIFKQYPDLKAADMFGFLGKDVKNMFGGMFGW